MADPLQPAPGPAHRRRQPLFSLVDRYVRVTDELQEIIEGMGGQPLGLRVASALKALPPSSSTRQRDAQENEALDAVMRRYQAEVEEPAFAMLRERKASGGSRMHKEPVTFSPSDIYPELLDGIDLRLPAEIPAPPSVTPLTLAISWPPGHHLRMYPITGFISSCHDSYLALHFGEDGLFWTGCYLVIDTRANSIAIIPPLATICFTPKSHGRIGSGVGILHQSRYERYVLVELYLRREGDRFSNKATLFTWWSTGSGPLADQWIQKEVVLPLPAHQDTASAFSFRANSVSAIGTTALCWTDLWAGILVCNGIQGSADDELVFHYIPLPDIVLDSLFQRRKPERSRSITVVDAQQIIFVCMDDNGMLTTWKLMFPLTQNWFWKKGSAMCILNLLDRVSIITKGYLLHRLTPSCPVISWQQPEVIYIFVTEFEYKDNHEWKVQGYYEVSANIQSGDLLSVFEFPSSGQPFPHARIFATDMSYPLQKMVGSIEGRVGVHHIDDAQQSKNFTFKCHREGNDIFSVNSLNFHPMGQHIISRGIPIPSDNKDGKKIPVGLNFLLY